MAYSYDRYTGDGSTDTYAVSFPYLSKDDVEVSVDANPTTFTWSNDQLVKLPAAPPLGSKVTVRRDTPKAARLIDFTDGSLITEEVLDTSALQNFYIVQEAYDNLDDVAQREVDGTLDMRGARIKNLGDPVDPTDAVNFRSLDSLKVDYAAVQQEALKAANSADNAYISEGAALVYKNEAERARDAALGAVDSIVVQSESYVLVAPQTIFPVPFSISADAPNFFMVAGGLNQQDAFVCDSNGDPITTGFSKFISTGTPLPTGSKVKIYSATTQALDDITAMYKAILAHTGIVLALEGPTSAQSNEAAVYKITNYSSFLTYTVSVSHGTVSITGDTITWNIGDYFDSALQTLTVYVDGNPVPYQVNVNPKNVVAPVILDPTNNSVDISSTPLVKTDAFSVVGIPSDTQTASQLQVARDSLFQNILFDSGEDTVNLTDIPVTTTLPASTLVFFRFRKKGTILDWSPWSSVINATTIEGLVTPILSGPSEGNEGQVVDVAITNYDATVTYVPTATGGTVTQIGGVLKWTLPSVVFDTNYTLSVYATKDGRVPSQIATHTLKVKAVPIQDGPTVVFDNTITAWPNASIDANGVHPPAYSVPALNTNQIVNATMEITAQDIPAIPVDFEMRLGAGIPSEHIGPKLDLTLVAGESTTSSIVTVSDTSKAALIYILGGLHNSLLIDGTIDADVASVSDVEVAGPPANIVPAMTSNSTGGFTVIAPTDVGALTDMWTCFDGSADGSTVWYGTFVSPLLGTVTFDKEYVVLGYRIRTRLGNPVPIRQPKDWSIKNQDGLVVDTQSNQINWLDDWREFTFASPQVMSAFAFNITAIVAGAAFEIGAVEILVGTKAIKTTSTLVVPLASVPTSVAIPDRYTLEPTSYTSVISGNNLIITGDEIDLPEDANLKQIAMAVKEPVSMQFKDAKIYIKERR